MLQIKLFAMRFCDELDSFDDEPLRAFLAGKEIVSIKEQFFFKDNVPYWSVMLMYKSKPRLIDLSKKSQEKVEDKKYAYRSVLTEESTPLFNLLREWRNEKAKKAGYPAFYLFNNLQLAQIAVKKPETLTQLASVEGVGKAKIKKYGEEILGIARILKEQQKIEKPDEDKEKTVEEKKEKKQKPPENVKKDKKDQDTLWDSSQETKK